MKRRASELLKKAACMAAVCAACVGLFSVQTKAAEPLTGKTAMEITQQMGKGWNLGNTLDATDGNRSDIYSQETSWGNPKVTKELIDGVKAAGFTTIRIPTTWNNFINKIDGYKIDEAFMDRIQEVVDYAYANDMYVILNVHHEAWVNDKDIDKNYEKIGEELVAVWKQIANRFADYDQHLIFEGMNEPRAQGTGYEWTGNTKCYDAVNYLDQKFVETIRANGKGYNAERTLMIPGYAASSSTSVLQSIKIPEINGAQAENVAISVHCYSPYSFCLSDDSATFNPKKSSDTAEINTLISTLNSLFISKGVPVVIGECGATNTKDNLDDRKAWFAYFGDITAKNNIPAVVWDNGNDGKSGGESHNYFNRKTGDVAYPDLVTAFITGRESVEVAEDTVITFEPFKKGDTNVMGTPGQFGFTPDTMDVIAKINHTEGAALGFSAVVTPNREASTASLDLNRFAGKNLNLELYLQSKSNDTVSISNVGGATPGEIISTAIDNTGWTKATFSVKFDESDAERAIIFKGTGADDFYIDDVSITMVEESDMVEAKAVNENGETASEPEAAEDASTGESSSDNTSDDSQSGETTETETVKASGNTTVIVVIVAAFIAILVIAGVVVVKRKK